MKKKVFFLSVIFSFVGSVYSGDIMLDVPITFDHTGGTNKVTLQSFLNKHSNDSQQELTSMANAYYNNHSLSKSSRCSMIAAYELAAIMAGDSDLLSWLLDKFAQKKVEALLNGDLGMQEEQEMQKAIFNSLAESCNKKD